MLETVTRTRQFAAGGYCKEEQREKTLMSSKSLGAALQAQSFHRHIEVHGVDDALPLKLNPDSIAFAAWEYHVELNLRSAVRDERMLMNHVDQIITGDQHVAPGREILLQTVFRAD